ncbi:hypothetical protein [Breoghania sp.]|uniref:hypothetical protein n=1 Tax=Breoghania sp. TaxID=2065378 RepID=UPI0029CA18F2|nr:hypothetical protein [Breoghania sp.]
MLRAALITVLMLLAPSAAMSGSAFTPEYAADIFWGFRKLIPDVEASEAYLKGAGLKRTLKQADDIVLELEYADKTETLFANLEKQSIPKVADNFFVSVSVYETDRTFVDAAVKALGRKLNRSDAQPLESDEGWEDTGWVMKEGDPTVVISVAYNAEHQLTKIWSHQLLVGDE